jgi:hypothetical protein
MTCISKRFRGIAPALLVLAILAPHAVADDEHPETLQIRRGDLDVRLRDNSHSPRDYLSGLDSLINVRDAPGFDAFDPNAKGASAGLNFEHIIAGHENPHNAFSPRNGPMRLERLKGGIGARLVRQSADDPWKISSVLEYRVIEPNAIDFEFHATPHKAELFGPHGYAIFFFADYMNDVADAAIHFRGVMRADGPESWISADAPPGPADWNRGGTYIHRDAQPLAIDKDVRFRLNSWSYDWPRYTEPFYYGRAAHGMTLILMFDRGHTPEDEIRFSLFKFKLPKRPRPAWDFQYVIHKVVSEKTYGFRGRLVWKKFLSADDCEAEYRRWASSRSH